MSDWHTLDIFPGEEREDPGAVPRLSRKPCLSGDRKGDFLPCGDFACSGMSGGAWGKCLCLLYYLYNADAAGNRSGRGPLYQHFHACGKCGGDASGSVREGAEYSVRETASGAVGEFFQNRKSECGRVSRLAALRGGKKDVFYRCDILCKAASLHGDSGSLRGHTPLWKRKGKPSETLAKAAESR